MANFYVSSIAYAAVAQWAASTAYSVGQIVRQVNGVSNSAERCFRCTTAGTSGATQPTWVTTRNGVTTESGGPVWTECTGQEAYQTTSGTWAAPFSRLINGMGLGAISDTYYLASDHNEAAGTGASHTYGNSSSTTSIYYVICVTPSTNIPPIATDISSGAVVTCGLSPMAMGCLYAVGVTFQLIAAGTLSVSGWGRYENCIFQNTVSGGLAQVANGNVELNNSYFKWTAGNAGTITVGGNLTWRNTTPAPGTWSVGTYMITPSSTPCDVVLENLDLSFLGGTFGRVVSATSATPRPNIRIVNCKLGTSLAAAINAMPLTGDRQSAVLDVMSSDYNDSPLGVFRQDRYRSEGTQTTNTQIAAVNGATTGTTPYSWWLSIQNASTVVNWYQPFECQSIVFYNTTVGSPITVTINAVWGGSTATVPNNSQMWITAYYLGNTGSPLGAVSDTKSGFLATPTTWTASNVAWDAGSSVRLNSTSYNTGQTVAPFSVSSNPGRLFKATASGTSAASLPAGYATAIDGGTLTDGSVTVTCLPRFSMSTTFTPQQIGPVRVVVKVAYSAFAPIMFIDPVAYIS